MPFPSDCSGTQDATSEQLELRASLKVLTPAHSPESTNSALLSVEDAEWRQRPERRRRPIIITPNAFLLFRRAQNFQEPSGSTSKASQPKLSKVAAEAWATLSHREKASWYNLARDVKKLDGILYADYDKTPQSETAFRQELEELVLVHTQNEELPLEPPCTCPAMAWSGKRYKKGQGTRDLERRMQLRKELDAQDMLEWMLAHNGTLNAADNV